MDDQWAAFPLNCLWLLWETHTCKPKSRTHAQLWFMDYSSLRPLSITHQFIYPSNLFFFSCSVFLFPRLDDWRRQQAEVQRAGCWVLQNGPWPPAIPGHPGVFASTGSLSEHPIIRLCNHPLTGQINVVNENFCGLFLSQTYHFWQRWRPLNEFNFDDVTCVLFRETTAWSSPAPMTASSSRAFWTRRTWMT